MLACLLCAAGPASRCAPAGRPTEAPNHLPYEVAQRRDLHEHVTHAASGECSSARAVGSRLQQARSFFPSDSTGINNIT